jgi:hypothetical protein
VAVGEAATLYFESGMTASSEEIAEAYRRAKEVAERDYAWARSLNLPLFDA